MYLFEEKKIRNDCVNNLNGKLIVWKIKMGNKMREKLKLSKLCEMGNKLCEKHIAELV